MTWKIQGIIEQNNGEKEKKKKGSLKGKKWYDNNQESLKEKARERKKRLREERKIRKIVQTRGLHKAQERCDIGAERKREAKKKKQEDEEKTTSKGKAEETNRKESSLEEDAAVFPSRMAKKLVKDKVTAVFPKSPRKKAAIIQDMVRSPSTRKILEKKGILKSPEEELETTALRSLAEDLAEGLSKVKKLRRLMKEPHTLLQDHLLLASQ